MLMLSGSRKIMAHSGYHASGGGVIFAPHLSVILYPLPHARWSYKTPGDRAKKPVTCGDS